MVPGGSVAPSESKFCTDSYQQRLMLLYDIAESWNQMVKDISVLEGCLLLPNKGGGHYILVRYRR